MKALRRDNRYEYVSNEFKDFCAKEGIQKEMISPHNLEQNVVAERKNRSIVGVTRDIITRPRPSITFMGIGM